MVGAAGSVCYGIGDIVGAVLGTFFSTVVVVGAVGFAVAYVICRRHFHRQQQRFDGQIDWRKRKEEDQRSTSSCSTSGHRPIPSPLPSPFPSPSVIVDGVVKLSPASTAADDLHYQDFDESRDDRQERKLPSASSAHVPSISTDEAAAAAAAAASSSGPRHSRASIQNSLYSDQRFDLFEVPLQSRDPIGLGLNVFGNLMEGIYVTELLHRGPARESGLIRAGDRIVSLTINLEHMVLEDALTILSYASSYPIKLLLLRERRRQHQSTNDDSRADEAGNEDEDEVEEAAFSISRLQHLFRSQSMEQLSTIQSRWNTSFQLRDDFPPFIGDGRWSAGVEWRRKRPRSALTDDHFRSATSRSDDDWVRWKKSLSQMTLRFSGCSLIAHAGSIGNSGSRGSTLNFIAADVKQRRITCLDLSRIPEAAAAADSCLFMKSRAASRLGLMSVGLVRHGPEKSLSVQAIVTKGDGKEFKESSNCRSLQLSTGSPLVFTDGRSVSDGDLLHDTRNRWPQSHYVRQKIVPSSNAREDLNTNPSAFSTQKTNHPNPVPSAAAAESRSNDALSCEEGAPENAGENESERLEEPDSEILFEAPKSNAVPAESENDEINREQKHPQPQRLDQNANVEYHLHL